MNVGRLKRIRKKYGDRLVLSIAKYKNSDEKNFKIALMVKGNNKFHKPILLTLELDEVKPMYTVSEMMESINRHEQDAIVYVNTVLIDEKEYEKPKQRGEE